MSLFAAFLLGAVAAMTALLVADIIIRTARNLREMADILDGDGVERAARRSRGGEQ